MQMSGPDIKARNPNRVRKNRPDPALEKSTFFIVKGQAFKNLTPSTIGDLLGI